MIADFLLPPRPLTARERASRWLKAQQLKLWLPAMSACESLGATESPLYYWLARQAIRCNRWRWEGR